MAEHLAGCASGKETVRHHLFESMKKVAETGQGPVEQMRSVGCSIKRKGLTDLKRTTAPYIGVLPSHVRGDAANSAAVRGKQTLRRPRQKRGDRPNGDLAPSAVHLAQSASLDGPFLRRAWAFIHHFAKRGMRSEPSSACHYARSTAAKNREEHDHRILAIKYLASRY